MIAMNDRIRAALGQAGLSPLPEKNDSLLADYGVDSLLLALLVSELEREFKFRIDPYDVEGDSFRSIDSIAEFLRGKGIQ